MFRLIDITIDIIFFSINWKTYFDRSILVISMTVLQYNIDISWRNGSCLAFFALRDLQNSIFITFYLLWIGTFKIFTMEYDIGFSWKNCSCLAFFIQRDLEIAYS